MMEPDRPVRQNGTPHIKWNHVDGPVLVCSDGTMHWLTLLERLCLKIGSTTIERLDNIYRLNLDCKPG